MIAAYYEVGKLFHLLKRDQVGIWLQRFRHGLFLKYAIRYEVEKISGGPSA